MTVPMASSTEGKWVPCTSINYGVAIHNFTPGASGLRRGSEPSGGTTSKPTSVGHESSADHSVKPGNSTHEDPGPSNPYQISLEVGDETYIFETYTPSTSTTNGDLANGSTHSAGTWYRGYVVSTSPNPRVPSSAIDLDSFSLSSTSSSFTPALALSDEPQVTVGIFPASHVQIREQLEDAEKRLTNFGSQSGDVGVGGLGLYGGSGSSDYMSDSVKAFLPPLGRDGRMEPLQEEEEEEEETNPPEDKFVAGTLNGLSGAGSNSTENKVRHRISVASVASFANQLSPDQQLAFQNKRLSQTFGGPETPVQDDRPNPPLPNLKCGDDTSAGLREPLIDEIACALREWASLLYTHLYRRNYGLFESVKEHIEVLHTGRKQLLANTLSLGETDGLRQNLVTRLVTGNVDQNLDVIVRHPTWGGLVDVDVEGNIDRRAWVSTVRMYAMQVALAYSGVTSDSSHLIQSSSHSVRTTVADSTNASSDSRLTVPNTVSLNSKDDALRLTSVPRDSIITAAKFFHVYVAVKAFVATPSSPGETVELYFALFDKTEAKFLTEQYCVILDHSGKPVKDSALRPGAIKMMFRDLSQHDVQDQIFLTCRIVRNGSMKFMDSTRGGPTNNATTPLKSPQSPSSRLSPGSTLTPPGNDSVSFDDTASDTGVDFGLGTAGGMLSLDGLGRQSYRRPFGCAVLEISQFTSKTVTESDLDHAEQSGRMPIFVPTNENTFSTLHEDIIGSRVKEFEKTTRAEHLDVSVRILYGEADELVRDNQSFLAEVPLTNRLGFPDVVFLNDHQNVVYIKLWSGDFSTAIITQGRSLGLGLGSTKSLAQLAAVAGAKNIEVSAEIRTKDSALVDRALSRGTGEPNVTQYTSMVYKSNNTPTWDELLKLEIPVELMEQCHVFLTFKLRGSKAVAGAAASEKPFAFAYFPLFLDNAAFSPDGSHTLVLYKYDPAMSTAQFYLQAPATQAPGKPTPPLPLSISKSMFPIKDTMVIRSFLVSTSYTQNETLLRLMRWKTDLLFDDTKLKDVLAKVRFCNEAEVCKFLRQIFDALFGIMASPQNQAGELDDLLFQAITAILGCVSDRRFTNFKPVIDVYIELHFDSPVACTHIIKSLLQLLKNPGSSEFGTTLRSSIKVWHYLFKFVAQSHDIRKATTEGFETSFKQEVQALLTQINFLMSVSTPISIIGTQTLAVQHFPSIIPDLANFFDPQELADIIITFGDSIVASKGKIAIWKILFESQTAKSVAFAHPTGRAALVPAFVRWLKSSLGRFDEAALCNPKDTPTTRDSTRVHWIEGIRLSVGVVAIAFDVVQEALIKPSIMRNRALLAQEQDNIEYLLGLLPRLMESFRELEANANLEAVNRQRSAASVVSTPPVVFPSSYPFSLLSYPPSHYHETKKNRSKHLSDSGMNGDEADHPTMKGGVGEIACLFIGLLHVSPMQILENWLQMTLDVEGKDNFARLLMQIFKVAKSILENDAYPEDWLNIHTLAHRVILRLIQPVAVILERDFIPSQQVSFTFNTSLWRDFFAMLLRLLSSPQLLIEDFSPQKRRAVWRVAGDLRGDGAKILLRLWNAIGWPADRTSGHTVNGRYGGYQVQFVPGLVEDILSLCLSHHDELRTSAVQVLHSMIIGEYYLNDDFAVIEAEVIDRLDKLFMSQTKGDEISRAFFVGQLRALFDEAKIDARLREQVDSFLASINSFLDLLLAVRNLPDGEEFQEDRIISTLKLMSFIRGIGRSEIYIRYVNRLVTFHTAMGNQTEAGLTLKLHADLHEWDLNSVADALPDLNLPRQSEFARKETLYMRILDHLGRGKAWETALVLCKELQQQYETKSFNYSRLSELMLLQSDLYASIVNVERRFGEFFRVAFYGSRFPLSVSGKQFIYRAGEGESPNAFTEKMLNKHPTAQLLKSSGLPSEEIIAGHGQFIQVTSVIPEPDRNTFIFQNPDVPSAVRAYYEHNDTQAFSFSRPVVKDVVSRTRVMNDFTSTWTEKTILICEDTFPTVLRRSEVVEIRLLDLSPIENALQDVETKTRELDIIERRFYSLAQTTAGRDKVNSNVLSMLLNEAVDAPPNKGVPMYRKAFFGSDYIAVNPDQTVLVDRLFNTIDAFAATCAKCLKLHLALCPPEMKPFHDTLQRLFEKNFAEEIARMPQELYDTSTFAAPTPTAPIAPTQQRNASISITSAPSIFRQGSIFKRPLADTFGKDRDRPSSPTPSTVGGPTLPPIASVMSTPSRPPAFFSSSNGKPLDVLSEVPSSPEASLRHSFSASSLASPTEGTASKAAGLAEYKISGSSAPYSPPGVGNKAAAKKTFVNITGDDSAASNRAESFAGAPERRPSILGSLAKKMQGRKGSTAGVSFKADGNSAF